jgi:hypothetical protein
MTTGTHWTPLVLGTTRRRLVSGSPFGGGNRFQSGRSPRSGGIQSVADILQNASPAISGSGGHGTTFHVACSLWRFLNDQPAVWAALVEYNATKCDPPWREKELRHKMTEAEKATRGERGFVRRGRPRTTMAAMQAALATLPKRCRPTGVMAPAVAVPPVTAPVVPIVKADSLTVSSPIGRRCPSCGGADWWRSEHREGICRRCHPPAPKAERGTA